MERVQIDKIAMMMTSGDKEMRVLGKKLYAESATSGDDKLLSKVLTENNMEEMARLELMVQIHTIRYHNARENGVVTEG